MIFLKSFLFAGIICMIGQIILDNTKLSAGHITSLFTVVGAILSFLGLYSKAIKSFGACASILITNFGHMLYQSGMDGFNNDGILGIFSFLLTKSSLAIVSAIIFSFIFAILFKPKS